MKVKKAVIVVAIVISIAIIALIIYVPNSNSVDNINPIAKISMLKITLEWGRLAPIPKSKTKFDIHTEGGSFTRSFRSSFYLNKADLEKWIKASPGLLDAEIQDINDSERKYVIKPGGGANYAEAVIDSQKCFVEIYVSWS